MRPYAKALLLSVLANGLTLLPFLRFHGVTWLNSLGFAAISCVCGLLLGWRINNRPGAIVANCYEWACFGALWPLVVFLIIQAVLLSFVQKEKIGTYLPQTAPLALSWVAAIVAFTSIIVLSARLRRGTE